MYASDSLEKKRCDTASFYISIEFKWDNAHNPFQVPFIEEGALDKQKFIKPTNKAHDTLGQITAYTSAQLSSQYHMHTFSVLIIHDKAL